MSSVRRRLPAVAGVLALTAGALFLSSAHAATQATPVSLAHLRLTITTTSDWTQVQLSPGRIVASHITSHSGTGAPSSLGFYGSTGTSTQTVDIVYYEPVAVADVQVRLVKGFLGSTTVTIVNANGATPASVATVTDAVHSVTDGSNTQLAYISRLALMTSTRMAERFADSRRLVLAFYYPWYFPPGDPTVADRPADPRSAWNSAGVGSMTAQAKAQGVNGFIVSWAGAQSDGAGFDTAMAAAGQQHQVISGAVEMYRAAAVHAAAAANAHDWLAQLLHRAGGSAFLKASDGVPVVFVFGMDALTPAGWGTVLNTLRTVDGLKVHLVGDTTASAYLPYEWGVYRYSATDSPQQLSGWSMSASLQARADSVVNPAVAPKLLAGTASPGFDDHLLRGATNPVVPRSASRYADTWNAAAAGRPDWMLVTSWNEWYEDTQIEPGQGTGSWALTQTGVNAGAWRQSS